MTPDPTPRYVAFAGERRVAAGSLVDVATAMKDAEDQGRDPVLAFDLSTGGLRDVELRGSRDDVRRWASAQEAADALEGAPATQEAHDAQRTAPAGASTRGRGRPKLGVVSKEVTLLPRHWAWLAAQRGGASATLRRLVDQARRSDEGRAQVRKAQDAAFRFMSAMAGDRPGFEEALRALFAADARRFEAEITGWPEDIRDTARLLAADALVADGAEADTPAAGGGEAGAQATAQGRG